MLTTYSPLPFPDSGIVLRGIGGSQIYVTKSRSIARMKGLATVSSRRYKFGQNYNC